MDLQKIFKHNLVKEIPLTTETINGKRHYVLPTGEKFRSVTTVISDKSDKTALFEWRKRIGEQEANKISVQAANRGTAVHNIAEKYVLNEANYNLGSMPSCMDAFNSIKSVLDRSVDNILGIELPLHSIPLKTAGRCDLIAEYNGIPSIIDYKTSRKLKKEEWITNYFIQTACYGMMFESMYSIKIPQTVVIIAVDNEKNPQIFIKNVDAYKSKVLEIFTGE